MSTCVFKGTEISVEGYAFPSTGVKLPKDGKATPRRSRASSRSHPTARTRRVGAVAA
jgi:hypothetical protein